MVKIKWTDRVSKEDVLRRIKEDEVCLYRSTKKWLSRIMC